ncbi:uncharacterized phosphotransferase YvkC [Caerostris extrusa]|uniref:Uncharacterized phosphotransferase YvkC n=1 Tax=Caerostris extrusa TaxID=172846 RepID=A0AAV4U9I8_CAEEX|nr:uncharacterized phosphotransferase YvkC [Caerostris extrusa]
MADAWIYLKLANGKTYNLAETMGYQQSSDDKNQIFSCGKLQMHYLSPMRRWRIFYCGMLKDISAHKEDHEESVFVKFVFVWRASSDVYDCTLDTNPEGFADAIARSEWKVPFVPPIKSTFILLSNYLLIFGKKYEANIVTDALNMYAQTGVVTGTVSVNDESDYEMYLFGERIRNLGKSASIVGCKFTSFLGNTPANGLTFHLTNVSVPYAFKNLPLGFVVDPDGNLVPLKELDIVIVPFSAKRPESSFKLNLKAGQPYEFSGSIAEPIVFYSGQGWSGYLDLSYIEFTIGNRKGSGLMFSGSPRKRPAPERSLAGKGSSWEGSLISATKKNTFIIPKGIIVTTAAYSEFLTPEILKEVKHLEDVAYGNQQGDLQAVCRRPQRCFGDEVNQKRYAVRSSATGEDTSAMSAAGQMDTFLGVKGFKEIFTAVKKCWASQFGHIAVEYKRRYGQILNSPMAVVVQEMVACDVSGVLFTCDPVTNNPSVITITANYGLGEVNCGFGSVEPDTLKLRRKDSGKLVFDSCVIGSKHQRIVMQDSGGTVTEDLDENSKARVAYQREQLSAWQNYH